MAPSFTSEAEEAIPLIRGGRYRLSGPPRGRPADRPPRDDAGGRLRRASLLYAKAEALGNGPRPSPSRARRRACETRRGPSAGLLSPGAGARGLPSREARRACRRRPPIRWIMPQSCFIQSPCPVKPGKRGLDASAGGGRICGVYAVSCRPRGSAPRLRLPPRPDSVRNLYHRASSDVDELLSALHEALKPMVAQIAAKAKKGKRLAAREVLLLYVYLMLEERASRGRPAERQGAPDGRAQPGAP